MEALLDCREEATVGKYCEQDVEIKRLETLLRIKGEVLPEVVLFQSSPIRCLLKPLKGRCPANLREMFPLLLR